MSVNVADTLLSVDNLMADPLAFVGDTIQVEGECSMAVPRPFCRATVSV